MIMNRKLPFTTGNYILFATSLLMLIVGYWMMSIDPHDSFLSLTLSPIVIMSAYAIVLPAAILKKFKQSENI